MPLSLSPLLSFPTSFLFLPVCSSLNNILSNTHGPLSHLPITWFETYKDCDMAFRRHHSQYY